MHALFAADRAFQALQLCIFHRRASGKLLHSRGDLHPGQMSGLPAGMLQCTSA